jgi:transcription initiation factor TFIIIB Brf1 subunit/transcription initiation factor TFIIB
MRPLIWSRVAAAGIAGAGIMLALVLGGCGSDDEPTDAAPTATPTATAATAAAESAGQQHPDVIDVVVEEESVGVFTFTVTISSPYDTPERYADGWRIVGPDGTVYGEHTLLHDHANEQPFTRTQSGVAIPADVDEVTVEGRDLEHGYGGETVTVTVDR